MPVFYNQQVWGLLSMMTNYLKTMTTVTALEYTNRKITMNRTYNKMTYFAKTISVLFGTLALLLSFSQLAHAQGSVTTTYYHTDVLGSVIAASDEDGDVIWNRTYDSFGREIISDSNGNELLDEQTYTGKPYDEETGLVYLGQRYYDPELRRFLSIDPVGFTPQNTESFNRYTYANNNPYKYVDPDGGYAEAPAEALSLAVGTDSLLRNIAAGNIFDAGVDGAGLFLDVIGAVLPVVPGVVSLGIRAGREGSELVADIGVDAAKGGGQKVFHFTDEAGAKAIKESGVIKPDTKGRVFVTKDKVSASEANNALFMGRGGTKGSHRVEIDMNDGVNLNRGTQPNELIHKGAIRNGRQGTMKVKKNDS